MSDSDGHQSPAATPTGPHEVRFEDPDAAYLLVAALEDQSDEAIDARAEVVPSPSGPAVLIEPAALDDPSVRWLVNVHRGQPVD